MNRQKHANRDRLHKKHMEAFLEYAKTQGYEVLPKPDLARYEVGRIKKGNEKPIIFFARENPTEHVTVPYAATKLVSDFIAWKKSVKSFETVLGEVSAKQ